MSVPEYVVVIIDGSCFCQSSDEELAGGDEELCLGDIDGGLEVLGEPSVSVQPSERAFDHPTAREELEAFIRTRSFDNLQDLGSGRCQCHLQLGPA